MFDMIESNTSQSLVVLILYYITSWLFLFLPGLQYCRTFQIGNYGCYCRLENLKLKEFKIKWISGDFQDIMNFAHQWKYVTVSMYMYSVITNPIMWVVYSFLANKSNWLLKF